MAPHHKKLFVFSLSKKIKMKFGQKEIVLKNQWTNLWRQNFFPRKMTKKYVHYLPNSWTSLKEENARFAVCFSKNMKIFCEFLVKSLASKL
eukprot:UN27955